MMRHALILAALGVAACSMTSGVGPGSNGGFATYDDLKAATAACAAKGGRLQLQKDADPQYLEDYACEKK